MVLVVALGKPNNAEKIIPGGKSATAGLLNWTQGSVGRPKCGFGQTGILLSNTHDHAGFVLHLGYCAVLSRPFEYHSAFLLPIRDQAKTAPGGPGCGTRTALQWASAETGRPSVLGNLYSALDLAMLRVTCRPFHEPGTAGWVFALAVCL